MELVNATIKLEVDHFNKHSQIHIAQLCHELKIIELYDARGAQIKGKLHWLKIGGKVSKESFRNFNHLINQPNLNLSNIMELDTLQCMISLIFLCDTIPKFSLPKFEQQKDMRPFSS